MNAIVAQDDMTPEGDAPAGWQLKKLTERHKTICSLFAQGMPRGDIATLTGVHPNYITMLMKQPLIQKYVKDMSIVAGVQLESMAQKVVDTIGEVMTSGNGTERLKAARLQAEMTGRIGSRAGRYEDVSAAEDRLNRLADRLTGLLNNAKTGVKNEQADTLEGEFQELQPGQ
jgi:hypothetical protein